MRRIYFDTETTGIPNKHLPWTDKAQPRIVSAAWVVVNEGWEVYEEYHNLVLPDGWKIDEEGLAFAAHKISNARCFAEGISISDIIHDLDKCLADLRPTESAAYNSKFDLDMFSIECEQNRLPSFVFPRTIDLMPLATIYCQLPPTAKMIAASMGGKFKSPKLSEALKIICGEEFPDAHDALADVKASIKIHRKLEEFRNGDSNAARIHP